MPNGTAGEQGYVLVTRLDPAITRPQVFLCPPPLLLHPQRHKSVVIVLSTNQMRQKRSRRTRGCSERLGPRDSDHRRYLPQVLRFWKMG